MKKQIILIGVIFLLVIVSFSGCTLDLGNENKDNEAAQNDPYEGLDISINSIQTVRKYSVTSPPAGNYIYERNDGFYHDFGCDPDINPKWEYQWYYEINVTVTNNQGNIASARIAPSIYDGAGILLKDWLLDSSRSFELPSTYSEDLTFMIWAYTIDEYFCIVEEVRFSFYL
jgi:hypothetical protein